MSAYVQMVDDVLAEGDDVDPVKIAEHVAYQVPFADLRRNLVTATQFVVRDRIRTRRRQAEKAAARPGVNATVISEVVCIRPGFYKRLDDCTAAELIEMATFLEGVRAEQLRTITRYRALAAQRGWPVVAEAAVT